jgi:DNA-binding MarR family transcriptional regulator
MDALRAVHRLTQPRGPTIRELCKAVGVTSSQTGLAMLERLCTKGLLKRIGPHDRARAFVLTEKGEEAAGCRRPTIVCLCGSTRFKRAYEEATLAETLAGRIVLSVGCYAHHDSIPVTREQKEALDALHLRKIALADEVLVLNQGGYMGESTAREIIYARGLGKPLRFLEPQPQGAETRRI